MKKVKLLMSTLLAIFVIVSCTIVPFAASATMSTSLSKSTAYKGDTVTVTVSLTSNPGVSGVQFTLSYNSSHIQYQSCSKGAKGSAFSMGSVNQNGATIKGAFLNADGTTVSGTGTLATITFKVISSSAVKTPLSVSASGTDSAGNVVSVSANGANLTIASNATTRPPVTTTRPPVTTTRPPVTTTRPPVTTTRPPVTTTKPETTTRPETTTEAESTTRVFKTQTIGVKKGFTYKLADNPNMSGKIVYTSSNTTIAKVDAQGYVTTLERGMTTIKAVSENGVTQSWVLIVGDGSTVVEEESSTLEGEETTTEIFVIGGETEEETTEERTTSETEEEKKSGNKGIDKILWALVFVGAGLAVVVIVVVIVSIVNKKKSFTEKY